LNASKYPRQRIAITCKPGALGVKLLVIVDAGGTVGFGGSRVSFRAVTSHRNEKRRK
jgi:hypothetical protein